MTAAPRSNSYHFVPVRDVQRAPGAACPLVADAALRKVKSPSHAVWLRLKDRMRLFETSTSDFTPAELESVKYQTGQLYLDVSRKSRLDDFAKDLLRLSPAVECQSCAKRTDCAGAYSASKGLDFAREEAALARILAQLRGVVVDVGSGHAPYAEQLASAAESGTLQYYGVETDQAARARLAQRLPWAVLLSDMQQVPPLIDHLLFLRSINHLSDPRASILKLLPRLAHAGTLLIVENVAFGVVRTLEQAKRAEASPARFEHFRNASAEDISQLLADLPLRLLERRDITPASSNQWLLRYGHASRQ